MGDVTNDSDNASVRLQVNDIEVRDSSARQTPITSFGQTLQTGIARAAYTASNVAYSAGYSIPGTTVVGAAVNGMGTTSAPGMMGMGMGGMGMGGFGGGIGIPVAGGLNANIGGAGGPGYGAPANANSYNSNISSAGESDSSLGAVASDGGGGGSGGGSSFAGGGGGFSGGGSQNDNFSGHTLATNYPTEAAGGTPNMGMFGGSIMSSAMGGSSPAQMMVATQQMQEMNQVFNLQYLQLQEKMQGESRQFTALSNVMKAKQDSAKNTLSNLK